MRIGAFEVSDELPQLRDPHIFAILQPWIDVGSVGTLALGTLESQFNATELGRLARPSQFYDLTRYRPMLYRRKGERIVEIPNTIVRYATGDGDNDFIFMHILEPHNNGEDFVDSLLELTDRLNVRRYCQVGAMYGSAPHTRPLLASGQASGPGSAVNPTARRGSLLKLRGPDEHDGHRHAGAGEARCGHALGADPVAALREAGRGSSRAGEAAQAAFSHLRLHNQGPDQNRAGRRPPVCGD